MRGIVHSHPKGGEIESIRNGRFPLGGNPNIEHIGFVLRDYHETSKMRKQIVGETKF